MNKVTRKKTSKYTTISNGFLRDNNLSLKAKGFLTVIMALPDDWDFSIKGICSVLKEGKTSVYSAVQELKENRYCKTTPSRDEKGLIIGLDYVFYEEPYEEEPNIEEPQQYNPHSENQDMDNMPQLNTKDDKESNRTKDLPSKEERDKSLSKKDELFEECWIAYRRKGKKGKAKTYWDKLKEDERGKVLQHIKSYVSVNELRYQQDFERYLRDKTFESIVVKGNIIVYDPTLGEDATYHPFGNNNIMWNDLYNCWLSIDDFNGSVIDGYNDENRPDGAEIVLHNARGTITWSKKNKKWNIEMKSPW